MLNLELKIKFDARMIAQACVVVADAAL